MTQEREQGSTCLAINKVIFRDTLPLRANEGFSQRPTKEILTILLLIALIPFLKSKINYKIISLKFVNLKSTFYGILSWLWYFSYNARGWLMSKEDVKSNFAP